MRRFGALAVTQLGERLGAVEVGEGRVRGELAGALDERQGARYLEGDLQQAGQVDQRRHLVGVDLEHLLVELDRRRQLALATAEARQLEPGGCQPRVDREGPPQVLAGGDQVLLGAGGRVQHPEVEVGLGVGAVDREGALVVAAGGGRLTGVAERVAEVVVDVRLGVECRQRAADEADGFVVSTETVLHDAEQVERVRVVGPQPQHLPVDALGGGEVTTLVRGEPGGEQWLGVAGSGHRRGF